MMKQTPNAPKLTKVGLIGLFLLSIIGTFAQISIELINTISTVDNEVKRSQELDSRLIKLNP